MKKSYRIRKNEEFSKIISKKHHFSSACFNIFIDNKKEEKSRVGISVSKKLGNAVTRNKIKRQIRMMLINVYDFVNSPYDVILIAKVKFKDGIFADNQDDLEKLLKKAIINDDK